MDKPEIDPDAGIYDVMSIYGALMLQVQTFEVGLAALALMVEIDPDRVSQASPERQLRKAIKKALHAFQAGSPSASRDRLKGRIPELLYDHISQLIPHRNRLAHRFLIEQIFNPDGGQRFRQGTALQIVRYAQSFETINREIDGEVKRIADTFPDAPDDLDELMADLARAIVLRQQD
jgi:hypothetical protein